MKYSEFFKMLEKKDHIIRKMSNLTDDQKQIAIDFFAKYPSYESDIDWNRKDLSWEDLEKVINKPRNTKSQVKKTIKSGIEGITEGEEYLLLGSCEKRGKPVTIYQPLTWIGSRTLASNKVPPVLTIKNPDGTQATAAKWCVAYQKEDKHWNDYLKKGCTFLYVFGESIYTKKIAIEIQRLNGGDSNAKLYKICCWDAGDRPYIEFTILWNPSKSSFKEVVYKTVELNPEGEEAGFVKAMPEMVLDLIEVSQSNYDLVKEKTAKEADKVIEIELRPLLDLNNYEETHVLNIPSKYATMYTSRGSDVEKYLIKDGKLRYNFGVVEGDFNCANTSLTSLEGCPTEVKRSFNISGTAITSLKGCPKKVGKNFIATNVEQLTKIDDFPEYVGNAVDLRNYTIKSIEGLYKTTIGEALNLGGCDITSLKGVPASFNGDLVARGTSIETLEGCPEHLNSLDVSECSSLESLKGKPRVVESYIDITECDNIVDLCEDYVTETKTVYYEYTDIDEEEIKRAFKASKEYYNG